MYIQHKSKGQNVTFHELKANDWEGPAYELEIHKNKWLLRSAEIFGDQKLLAAFQVHLELVWGYVTS